MIRKTSYKMKPPVSARPIRGHQLVRGQVLHLPFSEGSGGRVFDLSGYNNTGVFVADTHFVPGKFGPCLSFDGDGDYVNVAHSSSINISTGSLTVSSWTKSAKIGIIFSKDATALTVTSKGFTQYLRSNDPYIVFSVGDGSDYTPAASSYPTDLRDGKWHNVVGVWDAVTKTASSYVDGLFANSATNAAIGDISNSEPLLIGVAKQSGYISFWDGQLDLPMMWNRALSASEIALLYLKPFCMFGRKALLVSVAVLEVPCCSSCVAHGWLEVA